MRTPFKAAKLNTRSATDATFFTTVAAAERFVQLRIQGLKYATCWPSSSSATRPTSSPVHQRLRQHPAEHLAHRRPVEFSMFPIRARSSRARSRKRPAVQAFNFLDASGNLLVIFSDGEDTHAVVHGVSLDDILQSAIDAKVPRVLVRVNYDRTKGKVIPDDIWIPAVEKTGWQFFAASDETASSPPLRRSIGFRRAPFR